ncbi:hypothetical protein ABUV18_03009 (plasmid) [Clavibacter nebraskensis]|uniref:hypothetical protein n=1 Tax=Clavibacter nebraskensis TaxID=31963 RepID=UPI003DA7A56A
MASTPSTTQTARWVRPVVTTIIFVLALVVGFFSWRIQTSDPWWSNMLANSSAAVLLLIPGELILGQVRRRVAVAEEKVAHVETKADTAQATADAAKEQAEQTAQSLTEIEGKLIDAQRAELDAEIKRYRSVGSNITRETLLDALRTATADQLITAAGVRAPVWETDVHYRFVIDTPNDGDLVVNLETDDTTALSQTVWEPGMSAANFFQQLVHAVRGAGEDLGTGLNLPTESVEKILEMLAEVTQLRSQALLGYRESLQQIIERVNGWYFTEANVIPVEHLHYTIAVSRLDEMDWSEHLDRKGWHSAPWAIAFARRLYGMDTPAP